MANPETIEGIDISGIEISTAEVEQAKARGSWSLENEHHAQSVSYAADTGLLHIQTTRGEQLSVPAALLQGVAGASNEQIANMELSPAGVGIHWPELDADLLVDSLCRGVYGSPRWMASLEEQ
ncbi:MAG: DUF2442 domain-containing protein [Cyanobacteria bacterium J06606_4]